MLIKNIITNNLSLGLQFGARWMLSVILISVLSVEDFALFSFTYSVSNILLSVLPFGSSIFLIFKVKKSGVSIKALIESFRIILVLFVIILIGYLSCTPFFVDEKGWGYIPYGIILSFFLSLNLVIFSFYKGLGDFKKELFSYMIYSFLLLSFIGFIYFKFIKVNYVSIIFQFLIILNFLIFLIISLFTFKKFSFFLMIIQYFSIKKIILEFKKRSYFGLQEIVTAFYTQAGMLLLFYILDEKTYGFYRAMFVIIAPVFMLTVAISQVILNHLKKIDITNKIVFFRKLQLYTLLLGFGIIILFFSLKNFIFEYIRIENNQNSVIAFYIILFIILMRIIFANYEMFLVVIDEQKKRFLIMLIAAVVSLFLIFLILPTSGLIGAVSINAISYLIVLLGTLFFSEIKILKYKNQKIG